MKLIFCRDSALAETKFAVRTMHVLRSNIFPCSSCYCTFYLSFARYKGEAAANDQYKLSISATV